MSEPTYAFEVTESQLHQLASGTVDWSIIAAAADFAAQIDAERAAAKLVSASDVRLFSASLSRLRQDDAS